LVPAAGAGPGAGAGRQAHARQPRTSPRERGAIGDRVVAGKEREEAGISLGKETP